MDAYCTLANHFSEKPELLAIWGADIGFDNTKGWEVLENVLRNASEQFQLPLIIIHSTFRDIINCNELSKSYESVLYDEWWHGIQHGPAIIGHAAPIAYLRGYKTQYIASSFCKQDGIVTCSSYPTIDNYIKYCGCNTIHDGFEFTRQDKARVIYNFCSRMNKEINLHVCWNKQDGSNCCKCEKCLRTIAELLVLGANPKKFGFEFDTNLFAYMKKFIRDDFDYNPGIKKFWEQIQKEFINNKVTLKNEYYYRDIKWIEKFDFSNHRKWSHRKIIRRFKKIVVSFINK